MDEPEEIRRLTPEKSAELNAALLIQNTVRNLYLFLRSSKNSNDYTRSFNKLQDRIRYLNKHFQAELKFVPPQKIYKTVISLVEDVLDFLENVFEQMQNNNEPNYMFDYKLQMLDFLQMSKNKADPILESLGFTNTGIEADMEDLNPDKDEDEEYDSEKEREKNSFPLRLSIESNVHNTLQEIAQELDEVDVEYRSKQDANEAAEDAFDELERVLTQFSDANDHNPERLVRFFPLMREILEDMADLMQSTEDDQELCEVKQAVRHHLGKAKKKLNELVLMANMDDEDTSPAPSVPGVSGLPRSSEGSAWSSALDHYRPSKELRKSTVLCHIPASLTPVTGNQSLDEDPLTTGLLWALSMSEQYYYDNSMIIVVHQNSCPIGLSKVLRMSWQVKTAKLLGSEWLNVKMLGKGGFGEVFQVEERSSGRKFAIKYQTKMPKGDFATTRLVLDYLTERNYLIKARNSPYVVRFYESLQVPGLGGTLLVFEFCLGDLWNFISRGEMTLNIECDISMMLWNNKPDLIPMICNELSRSWRVHIKEIFIVYLFEMFAILDFLARCNIVHNDIKPQNIMIGQNLHLKIADMGLVLNTHMIGAQSQISLVKHNKLHKVDSINTHISTGGTPPYRDLEYKAEEMFDVQPNQYDALLNSDFPRPMYSKIAKNTASFASDMWAMAISAIEMLFMGYNMFSDISYDTLDAASDPGGLQLQLDMVPLAFILSKPRYERYVMRGLMMAGGTELSDAMSLIAAMFTPRSHRAGKQFTVMKNVRVAGLLLSMPTINLRAVEELSVFQSRGLTAQTAHTVLIKSRLAEWLDDVETNRGKKRKDGNWDMYATFADYLEARTERGANTDDQGSILPVQPGLGIAFPTD